MKKVFFVIAACALLGGAAPAHEFFVIPGEVKDYKSGDTVQINALSTHYFTVGEELEPAEVNEVYPVKNGVKGPALRLEKNADRVWYETNYRIADNVPTIIVGNRKGGFYCLFTDGGYADGKKTEVEAENPGRSIAKARYFAKYSKFYLNPDSKDASFSVPLGHDIEIIPMDNPAKIKSGIFSKAKFRVLYKGQPLTDAEVSATYDYYDYKTANAYAQTEKTDAKGEVSFKINHPGIWLVRVSDTRPSSYPGTDEDNNAAIVVFMAK
jgi:uncharacterized GH25 family protein